MDGPSSAHAEHPRPDFVVYPVDLHMEHLDRDMAAIPARLRKKLQARKEL